MIQAQQVNLHLNGTAELVEIRGQHVIVMLPLGLPTSERGSRLMNLEKVLRTAITPAVEVFLQPTQDMNKLRVRLRGVKVL